ncbi:hypothetical protein D3877_02770 [Azospirillum cavernae]|uniref:Type 4 secretion system PilS N-terminal domain-containing protein n=1 Tax=Azospirillum cavernae TaxID=2320860 RepID=A0A418W0Q1_9PROT|nr:hypothetical protein [Azospirillum cavernae]RJF83590.1 hypothetical protein D3877_02770 [Azospirillum cavernae]
MNLISAVVAVGLLATVTMGGVQYIGVDTEARVKFSSAADAGFQALESAFRARQAAGLAAPTAQTWEAALFPSFGARPTPPKDLAWSYGVDATGTWFCLSGTPKDQIAKTALERLKARYAEGIYAVAESCGAAAAQSGAVSATYWVVKTSATPAAATPSG